MPGGIRHIWTIWPIWSRKGGFWRPRVPPRHGKPTQRGSLARRSQGVRIVLAASLVLGVLVSVTTVATADPGATVLSSWGSQTVPPGLDNLILQGVSCSGDGEHCVAVGIYCQTGGCGGLVPSGILATADGGATWVSEPVPAEIGWLSAVSCASATDCVAVGDQGPLGPNASGAALVTTNGGTSWTPVAVPGTFGLSGVSCPSTSDCFAVGYTPTGPPAVIISTTDGGTNWGIKSLPSAISIPSAISCRSTTECIVTGGAAALTTTDGGVSWRIGSVPGGIGVLSGVACPSFAECVAVGTSASSTSGVIIRTVNAGVSWTSELVPGGIDSLGGIACPSVTDCVAAGTASGPSSTPAYAILATTNGGSSWTPDSVPAGPGRLDGVSCTASSACLAVGEWDTYTNGSPTDNGPSILSNSVGSPPFILSFSATPTSLSGQGQEVQLGWSALNATTCTLSSPQTGQVLSGINCANVSPVVSLSTPINDSGTAKTYTFTLTAYGAPGTTPAVQSLSVIQTSSSLPSPAVGAIGYATQMAGFALQQIRAFMSDTATQLNTDYSTLPPAEQQSLVQVCEGVTDPPLVAALGVCNTTVAGELTLVAVCNSTFFLPDQELLVSWVISNAYNCTGITVPGPLDLVLGSVGAQDAIPGLATDFLGCVGTALLSLSTVNLTSCINQAADTRYAEWVAAFQTSPGGKALQAGQAVRQWLQAQGVTPEPVIIGIFP